MITIGNFDYSLETDEKGNSNWLYKAKEPLPPKRVIKEPTEYGLQNVIEKSLKDDYYKTLQKTVKEVILYINEI